MEVNNSNYDYETWKKMEINDYSFRDWEAEELRGKSSAKSTKESSFKKFYNSSKESVKKMVGKGKATFEKIKNSRFGKWGEKIINNKYVKAGTHIVRTFFDAKSGKLQLRPLTARNQLAGGCCVNTSLYRRRDYDIVGGYKPNMKNGVEDMDFFISLVAMGGGILSYT